MSQKTPAEIVEKRLRALFLQEKGDLTLQHGCEVYLKRFDILTLLGDQVLISCRVKLEHEEREEPRGDQLTGDMRVDQQEEAHNITVLAFAFDGDCRVKKTMELPHLDLEEFWKRLKKCVETGKLEIS